MTQTEVLEKIEKLLALSKSSNPSEASIALNRAQKLMAEYNINSQDISLNSIGNSTCDLGTSFRDKSTAFALIDIIRKAFGVRAFITTRKSRAYTCTLVGKKDRLEIASYTLTILQRQIEIEKKAYKEKQKAMIDKEVRKHTAKLYTYSNQTLRRKLNIDPSDFFCFSFFGGDEREFLLSCADDYLAQYRRKIQYKYNKELKMFIKGWISSVSVKVNEFAISDEENRLLETYMNREFNLSTYISRSKHYTDDEVKAYRKGREQGESGFNLYGAINGERGTALDFKN